MGLLNLSLLRVHLLYKRMPNSNKCIHPVVKKIKNKDKETNEWKSK